MCKVLLDTAPSLVSISQIKLCIRVLLLCSVSPPLSVIISVLWSDNAILRHNTYLRLCIYVPLLCGEMKLLKTLLVVLVSSKSIYVKRSCSINLNSYYKWIFDL